MFSRFATQVPKAAIASAPLVGAAAFAQQQQTEKQAGCVKAMELLPLIGAAAYSGAGYYYAMEKIGGLEKKLEAAEVSPSVGRSQWVGSLAGK